MKKIISLLLFFLTAVSVFSAVSAQDEITVNLNGSRIEFSDQEPVIIDGRTMVPFRAIAESLGCIVEWYPEMREVYVAYGEAELAKIIVFAVDQQQVRIVKYFNTERGLDQEISEIKTDVAPAILNDRTMIPLRTLTDSMGADVSWDETTKTVAINLDNSGFVSASDNKCLEFLNERFYKVKYIYVSDEETADSVATLVTSGNFDKLSEQYSEDENREYIFTDGETIPQFEDAVKNLSFNEVLTRTIDSGNGFFIVKRLGFDAETDSSVIDDIRLTVLFINSGLDVE